MNMKRIAWLSFGALLLSIISFGCASKKDLQDAAVCKVWKESALGNTYADLEEGRAIVRQSCVIGNTGCDTKEAYFVNGTEIHMKGKLAPFNGKVGGFSKGKLTLTPPGLFKAMAPDKIEWKTESVLVSTTVMGHTGIAEYFFNKKCSPEQIALGTLVLAYGK